MGSREQDKDHPATDPAAWLDLYGDYLFSIAMSRLRDPAAAEDVVQETFLAALKGRTTFAGRSTERTWLVGILKNKIVDHLRRLFREQTDSIKDDPIEDSTVGFVPSGEWAGHWNQTEGSPVDWGSDPAAFVERREFWEVFDRCLRSLPPRLAAVFILHEMEDMSGDQICKELGITATNMWVMLHRARRRLRHCLEANWISGAALKSDRRGP